MIWPAFILCLVHAAGSLYSLICREQSATARAADVILTTLAIIAAYCLLIQ